MSRSDYADGWELSNWDLIRWRGAVASAIRGKRGQAFLRELLDALDALPEKRLLDDVLVCEDGCCAMGAVAIKRGLDVSQVDADEPDEVASTFGISNALAREIAFENDDEYCGVTPEERFNRMRAWVLEHLMKAGVA